MNNKLLFVEQAKEITKMHKNRIINRLITKLNKRIISSAKCGITTTYLYVDDIDKEIIEDIAKMCKENGFKCTFINDSRFEEKIYKIIIAWD